MYAIRSYYGLNITSMDVSRATAVLDEELELWRERALGKVRYLLLDARYEKVRTDGSSYNFV